MKKRNLFKKLLVGASLLFCAGFIQAQAPANAPDVILQGFYWDSYGDDDTYGTTRWANLMTQVDELSANFSIVWLPPASSSEGGCGYHPKQWSNLSTSWGTKTSLKNLIAALKTKGTRAMADIVINHRAGNFGWVDFCNEDFGTYGTFTLCESTQSNRYICSDDEASGNGYTCTGAKDAGYDTQCSASGGYCPARDLDHSNTYVQNAVKAYLQWMKNEIGYDGWRYDLVKGYLGKYTKAYNEAAGAYMSVGEYWDGDYNAVKNWINETSKTSCAFDFPMKYAALNNSLAKNNYAGMASGYGVPQGLCGADEMKRYSVTFVDNHDTFRDTNKFGGDWEAANAYILSAPGIPCVFYPHWVSCKEAIKKMIAARKACGVHSQSAASTAGTNSSYYKCTTIGTKGTLICFIGSGWSAPQGYTLAGSGSKWAYYTSVQVPEGPTVTMSPNGGYVGPNGQVTLSTTSGTIYYTTDGTTPSSSSTQYTSAITITTNNTTIKAIAIDGAEQSSIVSGKFLTEQPAGINVSFKAPSTWTSVSLYAWTETNTEILGAWPGTALTKSGDYYTYTITETEERPVNIIFNDNDNGHQTIDLSTSDDHCWDGSAGTGAIITPTTCDVEPSNITIKLKNHEYFSTSNCHIVGADWPGATVALGQDGFYSINATATSLNVIFNNGGNGKQTTTISSETSICVQLTGETSQDEYSNTTYLWEETSCPGTAVDETIQSEVNIYPNPTSGIVSIQCDEEIANVIVRDMSANRIYEGNSSNFDISFASPAMYFVEIQLKSGQNVIKKLIKK